MAERADLSVDWSQSPRIIWVNWINEATRELTLQDLHDTAKGVLEYALGALDDAILLESEGKAELSATEEVAITTTLQNAVIAFAPNYTVVEDGTATSDDAAGTTLTDAAALFVSSGVVAGAHIRNKTDDSVASVIKVISETQLLHTPLSNGTNDDWEIGDVYEVINVLECWISGGNLVAVDAAGDPMEPLLPTSNIFVSKTLSTGATLLEIDDIATIKTTTDAIKVSTDVMEPLVVDIDAIVNAMQVVVNDIIADTAAMEPNVQKIHDARFGGWEIDQANKQLVYKRPNGTELARFSLFKADDTPGVTSVYKRVPT